MNSMNNQNSSISFYKTYVESVYITFTRNALVIRIDNNDLFQNTSWVFYPFPRRTTSEINFKQPPTIDIVRVCCKFGKKCTKSINRGTETYLEIETDTEIEN